MIAHCPKCGHPLVRDWPSDPKNSWDVAYRCTWCDTKVLAPHGLGRAI